MTDHTTCFGLTWPLSGTWIYRNIKKTVYNTRTW